jgi:hypothetical protein
MQPQNDTLQIYDIHLPDPVSAWPPAPGWWLLLIVILLAAVAAFFVWRKLRQRWQRWQRRSGCLQQLQNLRSHFDKTDAQACAQINEILKLYCQQYFPQAVALHGQAWVDFLNQKAPVALFHNQSARALAEAPYAPPRADWRQHYGELDDLLALAQRWLKSASTQQHKTGRQPAAQSTAQPLTKTEAR